MCWWARVWPPVCRCPTGWTKWHAFGSSDSVCRPALILRQFLARRHQTGECALSRLSPQPQSVVYSLQSVFCFLLPKARELHSASVSVRPHSQTQTQTRTANAIPSGKKQLFLGAVLTASPKDSLPPTSSSCPNTQTHTHWSSFHSKANEFSHSKWANSPSFSLLNPV